MGRWLQRLWCCVTVCLAAGGAAGQELAARVDAVFAAWDKNDTPGLALAVVQNGRIVYRRGYGLAHLESGSRNTPATVFHGASLSKQFTAFAIHLLAQDGKLSLDDEVRKHLPELQVAGPPITIRHLLHHTSGLRDQWDLLRLAGQRLDDVITEADILVLLYQQKELNFAPGEQHLYSNSGYTLLSQIVKRVSGQTLAAFAQARIFGPLGMIQTHFQESYGHVVPGRAYSYQRAGEGWRYVALSYSNVGATSLFTTVEDLAMWDQNFYEQRVGGAPLHADMLKRGRLNNGRDVDYASGLMHGRHRGLPIVEHSGADAGYRAHVLRSPEQHFSVILLGNAGNLDAGTLTRRVADLYLQGTPGLEALPTFPVEVELQPSALSAYLGDYEMRPGFVLSFTELQGQLQVQATGQPRFPMFASAHDSFFTKAFEASVRFDAPGADGRTTTATATWRQGGRDLPLRRIQPHAPQAVETLQACVGSYYSVELRSLYELVFREGKLLLRTPRGVVDLKAVSEDLFSAMGGFGTLRLLRNAEKACNGFAVNTGRVRQLKFQRVTINPAP